MLKMDPTKQYENVNANRIEQVDGSFDSRLRLVLRRLLCFILSHAGPTNFNCDNLRFYEYSDDIFAIRVTDIFCFFFTHIYYDTMLPNWCPPRIY